MTAWSLELDRPPPSWLDRAACKGMGTTVFFVVRGASQDVAMEVCRSCPVRDDCLEFAMDNHVDHGVWGGLSVRGRRRLRLERGAA